MARTLAARLEAIERLVSTDAGVRRGYSLEQLVLASMKGDVGPPTVSLAAGEMSLEELVIRSCVVPHAFPPKPKDAHQ